jgi:ABC-type arginine transport system permease subunit
LRDLTALVSPGVYIEIPPFGAGVAALGAISGAYATEIFRGSIQAVPVGQAEGGRALGLSEFVIFFRITLPQAIRLAVPALGNLWLVILKDAALISVVGIRDLVGVAASGAARTREPFTFYFTVALVFLSLSVLSMIALYYLEKRTSRGFEER